MRGVAFQTEKTNEKLPDLLGDFFNFLKKKKKTRIFLKKA